MSKHYARREPTRSLMHIRVRNLAMGQSNSTPASPEHSPQHHTSKSSTFLTSSRTIEAALPRYLPQPSFTLLPSPHLLSSKPPLPSNKPLSKRLKPAVSIITKCGFKTRTGTILSRPKKHNQDTYIAVPLSKHGRGQYLFAICDGHGAQGHLVSRYLKETLPKWIETAIPGGGDWQTRLYAGLMEGIGKTVEELSTSEIDIKRSGSTCVAVAVGGKTLVCANIGDSRAVVVRETEGNWSAEALSVDHKPDLAGEYERIVKNGGRVSPYHQANGTPLGPARVWYGHDSGLAMSRSIGDSQAHAVGVISDPDLTTWEVKDTDRALVLASDGLWEFVSNKEVADIVGTYWADGDLEGTCDQLVRVAVTRWRREDVVDDITVLVVYLHA